MVAIKQAIPRLGNPQKQQGAGGKDHPALPQPFFPLPGEIIAVESRVEAMQSFSTPPIAQRPILHRCLWHRYIPSGLEDRGIRHQLTQKKPHSFKGQLQKEDRMDPISFPLIGASSTAFWRVPMLPIQTSQREH